MSEAERKIEHDKNRTQMNGRGLSRSKQTQHRFGEQGAGIEGEADEIDT